METKIVGFERTVQENIARDSLIAVLAEFAAVGLDASPLVFLLDGAASRILCRTMLDAVIVQGIDVVRLPSLAADHRLLIASRVQIVQRATGWQFHANRKAAALHRHATKRNDAALAFGGMLNPFANLFVPRNLTDRDSTAATQDLLKRFLKVCPQLDDFGI